MISIAVTNLKGGSGKTTVATHTAVALVRLGLVTFVLDLDDQGSSAVWNFDRTAARKAFTKRLEAQPEARPPRWLSFPSASEPGVLAVDAEFMGPEIKKAERSGTDVLIFDTVAKSERIARLAIARADYVVVPMKLTPIDLKALPATLDIIRTERKPYSIVFSDVNHVGSDAAEYAETLKASGHSVAPYMLGHRKAFYSHMHVGATAQEHDPEGKAAEEVRALTLWLCEQTGILVKKLTNPQVNLAIEDHR